MKKQFGKIKTKYTIRADGRLMCRKLINGIQKTIYGKNDKEIDDKIRELEMQVLLDKPNDNTMLDIWATKWFQTSKEGKVSYRTEELYKNRLNNHILPYFHNIKIIDVKPMMIQEFINSKAEYSNSMQHQLINDLNQIFNSAIQNGIISINPTKDIKLCGVPTKEKTALTKREQDIILDICKDTRAELFINIALYCGLRRGEVLALTWEDIDFNSRILTINKAIYFKVNIPLIKPPKTKAGNRQIPIPPQLLELLKNAPKKGKYVISNTLGELMSLKSFRGMWDIIINRLQKPTDKVLKDSEKADNMIFEVTSHKLRHTYCTNLYYAGIDLKMAQYLMGHSSITVTAQIYTHLDNSQVLSAQKKLEEYYNSVSKVCQAI